MNMIKKIAITVALILSFASLNPVYAGEAAGKDKLVIQVSDGDAAKWNLALNNAKNVMNAYGADKVEVEIVTYGPGIGMLKMDSVIANRIDESKKSGVSIVACQNTMKNMKLTNDDMLPNTSYVPSGVVEIMKKQKEGYAYLRP